MAGHPLSLRPGARDHRPGHGRRLFSSARRDLLQSGLKSMVVWALSDNDPATEFYRALGGRMVARSSEKFGPKSLDKVAFAWTN